MMQWWLFDLDGFYITYNLGPKNRTVVLHVQIERSLEWYFHNGEYNQSVNYLVIMSAKV